MSGGRKADGRVLRGRRNHQAVVEALLALIDEGELKPTAEAIADRAGLSRRTVFQHFRDMESTYEAAAELVGRRLRPYLCDVDVERSLAERLAELLVHRRGLLLTVDPMARSSRLREYASVQLQSGRSRLNAVMREQCRRAFSPELDVLPTDEAETVLAAVSTALSWPFWDHLRVDLGYAPDRIMAVMSRVVTGLLGEVALGQMAVHPG